MKEANGGSIIYHFKAKIEDLKKGVSEAKGLLGTTAKIGAGMLAGVGVAGTAMAGVLIDVTKKAVEAYAEVEQSIGGVETLFKDSADEVIANAQRAYKTAGVDANTYMQQVTSFSASLLQSLGGDTKKASEVADMAMQDMSDNANKFGTDIANIQSAYQAFAKQNFTLLDNLKLGYGGTRGEMERLLEDAEKISGIHYNIDSLNDMYQAIHVIQENLGVTGTTAKEAMTTISGSVNAMKASFQNLLSGQGTVDQVVETVTQVGINLSQAIIKILPQVAQGIVDLINGLMPLLPNLIETLLPVLLEGVVSLMTGIVNALPTLLTTLASMLPTIVESLVLALGDIAKNVGEMMPQIIPPIVTGLVDALIALLENVDVLIDGTVALVLGLADGIMIALPLLLEKAPLIVEKLASALVNSAPLLIEGVLKLALEIPATLSKVIGMLPAIGKQMVEGLWKGLGSMKQWVIDRVKGLGKSILSGLKSILGIHSPSTEFAFVGKMSILGYTDALEDMKGELNEAIQSTFSLSPELTNTTGLHYSPNVIVNNQMNMTTDPLGQVVGNIKTFSNGAKNDYNYGMGV